VNPSQEPPQPSYGFDPAAWEEEPKPYRRPWRRVILVGVLSAVAITAAGLILGVIWHFAAPTVPVIDAGQNGIVVNDPSPEEYVASDGWFSLIGFAFGLIVAILAWLVLRRDRGPGLLLGVAVGALGAAWVGWQAGRQIGLGAYEKWRDTAAAGATFHAPPDLHTHGALLVPAFAAAIVMTLLAGWSNDPDLERPGALPGYSHNGPPGGGAAFDRDFPPVVPGGPGYAQPGQNPGDAGYPPGGYAPGGYAPGGYAPGGSASGYAPGAQNPDYSAGGQASGYAPGGQPPG
jgi:hypothetical protein